MKRTHGMSKTRFYGIWNDMMMRCYNPNKERYSCYGARGIKVCDRWHTFQNFYDDMYSTYEKGLSLERDNVNGNYEPSNCKWIPVKDQKLNKQAGIIRLTVDGVEKIVSEWAAMVGVSAFVIYGRYEKGWNHKDCVFGRGGVKRVDKLIIPEIQKMRATGVSIREISRTFKYSHTTISDILKKESKPTP